MVILQSVSWGSMILRSCPYPGAVAKLKWAISLRMRGNMSWIEGNMRAMTWWSMGDSSGARSSGSGMAQNWECSGLSWTVMEERTLEKNAARSVVSLGKVQWCMKSS